MIQRIRLPLSVTLLTLLTLGSASAQHWVKQAPNPSPSHMASCAVVSPLEIWATAGGILGQAGKLLHTIDAGQSWDIVSVGNSGVNALFFLDGVHGWAAGNGFFHTTDGGQSWIQDNNWGSIYDLFFLDTQRGWAGGNGGVAYYTTNGGLTWTGVSTGAGTTISSIWFTDAQNGWAVGIGGKILQSTNGGQTWSPNHQASAPNPNLQMVQFVTPQLGYVIGGSTFLKTTNGGQTWSSMSVPAGTWAYAARFYDAQTGIAVGSGDVLRTTDGGQNWTAVPTPGSGAALTLDVEFANSTTAVRCGDKGTMSMTTDAGQSWFPIQTGDVGHVRGMDVLDDQTAWASSEGGTVLRTITGGTFWDRVPVGGFDENGELHDVDFADANSGWAVGWNPVFGASDEGRIARSTDGGVTWTHQLSVPLAQFFGVTALDAQNAIAYGLGVNATSLYLRTTDGGQTWNPGGPAATGGFRDAFFLVDGKNGWLLGTDIFKTADGGLSWTRQYQGSTFLTAVSFSDPLNGWVTGYLKTLLRTIDGGLTWTPQNAGGSSSTGYFGISATGPQSAWVCGWNDHVAETTNGGQTWTPVALPDTNVAIYDVARFVDHDNGWIAGNEGIWRRSGTLACPQAKTYGQGCPGAGGLVPKLAMSGCTLPGDTVALSITDGKPGSTALLVFGAGEGAQPLGFGCTLLAVPVLPLTLALPLAGGTGPGAGSITLPAMIPPTATPGFVTLQAFSLDAEAPIGAAASNGLRLDIP